MRQPGEIALEFRRDPQPIGPAYPELRGLVVYLYGGTIEECVERARKELNLEPAWKLISALWGINELLRLR